MLGLRVCFMISAIDPFYDLHMLQISFHLIRIFYKKNVLMWGVTFSLSDRIMKSLLSNLIIYDTSRAVKIFVIVVFVYWDSNCVRLLLPKVRNYNTNCILYHLYGHTMGLYSRLWDYTSIYTHEQPSWSKTMQQQVTTGIRCGTYTFVFVWNALSIHSWIYTYYDN